MASDKTTGKIRAAFGYSVVLTLAGQIMGFSRSVVVARLVLPEVLGVFGLAMAVLAGSAALSSFGSKSTLIIKCKEGTDAEWLNTVWVVEMTRYLIIAGVLFLAAPRIATYFENDALTSVLRVLSFGQVFVAFQNPAIALEQKRLNFKVLLGFEGGATLVCLIASAVFAYWLGTAEALAWAIVVKCFFATVFSYILCAEKPRFALDRDVLYELWAMGRHIFVIGAMTFITTKLDDLALGKLTDSETLGFYTLAFSVAVLPVMVVGQVLNRVMLPAYSSFASKKRNRLFQYWHAAFWGTPWLLIPLTLPLLFFREELLVFVYGVRWTPAAAPLSLLIIAGIFRAWTHASGPVFFVTNRAHIDSRLKVAETIVFAGATWWLVAEYGLMGAATASLSYYCIAFTLRAGIIWHISRRTVVLPWFTPLLKLSVGVLVACGLGVAAHHQLPSVLGAVVFGVLLVALVFVAHHKFIRAYFNAS